MENMKIKNWILNTTNSGSWKNYDDLHIDEVDSKYKSKEQWVNGGIRCFQDAISIIKELGLPFIVELSFSLESKNRSVGVNFQDFNTLEKECDWSPPSLYLFLPEWPEFIDGLKKSTPISNHSLNIKEGTSYYCESYNENDNEYRRVFFIISNR